MCSYFYFFFKLNWFLTPYKEGKKMTDLERIFPLSLLLIPAECTELILLFLEPESLVACQLACHRLSHLASRISEQIFDRAERDRVYHVMQRRFLSVRLAVHHMTLNAIFSLFSNRWGTLKELIKIENPLCKMASTKDLSWVRRMGLKRHTNEAC